MVSFFFFFLFTEKKDLIADDTRDYKDEEPEPAMKRQPRPTRASIGLEKPDRSRRQSFPLFVLFCHKEKRVGSCTICGFHITVKRVHFNFANFASKTIRKIKMLAEIFIIHLSKHWWLKKNWEILMPFKWPNVAIHEIFMLYSIMKNNGSRCYSVIQ